VPGAREALERPLGVVGVGVLVEVDAGVGAEVDRVRAGGEGAVVVVRVEDLNRQGLPAAGRATVEEAGPTLADAAEAALDLGQELAGDGVAVGAEVGRVDGVGVVVIGVRVLDLDH
jgi:hypothetical protein